MVEWAAMQHAINASEWKRQKPLRSKLHTKVRLLGYHQQQVGKTEKL